MNAQIALGGVITGWLPQWFYLPQSKSVCIEPTRRHTLAVKWLRCSVCVSWRW